MAMNPMQRRARNSFLIGFLVALIIMAVVVLLLLYKIKGLNESLDSLKAKQSVVYVANADLRSGEILNFDEDFKTETVQTTVLSSEVISADDWDFYDQDGNMVTKLNDDGSEKKKEIMLKVDVPAGTIVTKDMITEVENETKDSDRIQEYNMLVLPSRLRNGDYIDIRLLLPSGKDYIVLSKKQVLGCNDTTIWLKVSEEEILLLNNAIVEAYTINGSKLYASIYAEAGMQNSAQSTYLASTEVMALIMKDPNIVSEASTALWNRYDITERNQNFDAAIEPYRTSQDASVATGHNTEVSSIKAARQQFVSDLEGTEDVGYDR